MKILAIETSCDETSAAVLQADQEKDELKILSNIISSQADFHEIYGGVVPEIAARHHLELINFVIQKALDDARLTFSDLNLVGVTYGPGLVSSLLIGIMAAKAISFVQKIPLIGVNHVEGHIYANFLAQIPNPKSQIPNKSQITNYKSQTLPTFPFVSLIVSGGHTELIYAKNHGEYELLGKTRDDAAGEAFDKVARFLNLGYPGGPIIDELAKSGNAQAIDFPRPLLNGGFDFSFSGLKTAVVRFVENEMRDTKYEIQKTKNEVRSTKYEARDIAASFQQAIVDVLVKKSLAALKNKNAKTLVLAGGVAANSCLRKSLEEKAKELKINLFCPTLKLCTDNAVMIAVCAYYKWKRGAVAGLDLAPLSRIIHEMNNSPAGCQG